MLPEVLRAVRSEEFGEGGEDGEAGRSEERVRM